MNKNLSPYIWLLLFAIMSFTGCSTLPRSNPLDGDSTAPAVPTGLVATKGSGQITLNWTANSEADLAGYDLYYDDRTWTSPQTYADKANSSLITSASYTVTGLTNNTTYYFWVRAVDKSGNVSSVCSSVTCKPGDVTPPSAPTYFSATLEAYDSNYRTLLSWDMNPETDISYYYVYRSRTSGGTYTYLGYVSGRYTVSVYDTPTDRTAGTKYYYVITAVDSAGNESSYSAEKSVTY